MNIQLLSDIHLEFSDFTVVATNADVLVLAGDIHVGTKAIAWAKSLSLDIPIIYVLGNHEWYKQTYPKLTAKIKEHAKGSNIHVLEADALRIGDVSFHGVTLWTDFELLGGDPRIAGSICQEEMTDYKRIRILPNYSKLRTIDTAMIHYRSRKWLRNSLLASDAPYNVVVTHHAPSLHSIPVHYREDVVSNAYASSLETLIRETLPNLWLHGHVHQSCDYLIDDCRVVCNPRGYHGDNLSFDPTLVVSLP